MGRLSIHQRQERQERLAHAADIKTASLTSSDVKNRSLLARDFKTGQLIGLVLFECNEEPGAQDVQLQAQVSGASVDVGTRSLALTEWQDLP